MTRSSSAISVGYPDSRASSASERNRVHRLRRSLPLLIDAVAFESTEPARPVLDVVVPQPPQQQKGVADVITTAGKRR